MAVSFCMILIMIHCTTIYSPITCWSILKHFRKLWRLYIFVGKNHLKPYIFPAKITYWWIWFQLYLFSNYWRYSHDFPIKHVCKLLIFYLFQHKIKYIFWIMFLWEQKIFNCIVLKFVSSQELCINLDSVLFILY